MKGLLFAAMILGMITPSFAIERMSVSPAVSLMALNSSNDTALCLGYRIGIGIPMSSTDVVNVDYFYFGQLLAYKFGPADVPTTYRGIRIAKPITIKIEDIRFKIIPGMNLISENIFSGESTQRLGISLEFDSENRWGENTSIISGLNFIADGYCSGISYFVGGKGYIK